MAEETVDVEVNLGKEQADRIKKMSKPELINRLVVMVLRNHVQDETVAELEKDKELLKKRIDLSHADLLQARAMIESVIGQWQIRV